MYLLSLPSKAMLQQEGAAFNPPDPATFARARAEARGPQTPRAPQRVGNTPSCMALYAWCGMCGQRYAVSSKQ